MPLSTEDRLAIMELTARYCHALDFDLDADAWAACFTPDGTFIAGENRFQGTRALHDFAAARGSQQHRHLTTNHIMDGDGTTATHTCYMQYLNVAEGKALANVRYKDQMVKQNGRWLLKERRIERL